MPERYQFSCMHGAIIIIIIIYIYIYIHTYIYIYIYINLYVAYIKIYIYAHIHRCQGVPRYWKVDTACILWLTGGGCIHHAEASDCSYM